MLTAIMRQGYLHVFAASQGHFGSPQLFDDFLGSVSFFSWESLALTGRDSHNLWASCG